MLLRKTVVKWFRTWGFRLLGLSLGFESCSFDGSRLSSVWVLRHVGFKGCRAQGELQRPSCFSRDVGIGA